jgi:uncharacterized protein (DUF924 family)
MTLSLEEKQMQEIEDVLSYWLTPSPRTEAEAEARKEFWFTGSAAIDEEIRRRFGALVAAARAGRCDDWSATPRGALALIILIDQFSRNLYRGTPEAFSHDGVALALARAGFDAGHFDAFDPVERMFAALPFRHAEDLASQKRGVALAVTDALSGPAHLEAFLIYSVDWARKHLDVIVRFGRFPHRNPALGRPSTPAELEYLAYLKRARQWL